MHLRGLELEAKRCTQVLVNFPWEIYCASCIMQPVGDDQESVRNNHWFRHVELCSWGRFIEFKGFLQVVEVALRGGDEDTNIFCKNPITNGEHFCDMDPFYLPRVNLLLKVVHERLSGEGKDERWQWAALPDAFGDGDFFVNLPLKCTFETTLASRPCTSGGRCLPDPLCQELPKCMRAQLYWRLFWKCA